MVADDQPDLLGWEDSGRSNEFGLAGGRLEEVVHRGLLYIARDLVSTVEGAYHDSLQNVILLMLLALEEGSLCLREGEIEGILRRAFLSGGRVDSAHIPDLAKRFEAQFRDCFDSLEEGAELSSAGKAVLFGSSSPLIGAQGLLVPVRSDGLRCLYFRKQLESLLDIRRGVEQSRDISTGPSEEKVAVILKEVLEDLSVRAGGAPLRLTDEQKEALEGGLKHSLFLLSGGPGTGKTTIIVNLLRCLIRIGCERIQLAAPTGKAAARMAESIQAGLLSLSDISSEDRLLEGLRPVTLHRLLGLHPGKEEPLFGANHPLDADVLVVDEVSMVDVVMMARIFRAVDFSRTRLVLIGDRDQLPSVEAGAVVGDIIDLLGRHGDGRFVVLTKGHRSLSAVRAASAWINSDGIGPDPLQKTEISKLPTLWQDEAALVLERADHATFPELISTWMGLAFTQEYSAALSEVARLPAPRGRKVDADVHPLAERLFACLNSARVLTVLRRGPVGAETWNRLARIHLAQTLGSGLRGSAFSGLPVLILRNDPLRSLSNGDTGLMVEFRGRRLMALFRTEGGWVAYTPDVLPLWEPAFAMTVHKSQGSEYDRVLLVLPDDADHPLMTRQILYTGITRARRLAVISGDRSGIAAAAMREWKRVT